MDSHDVIRWCYNKGYRIDDDGNLVNPKGKTLNQRVDTRGYFDTNVRIGGKLYHLQPHRLCAYQKFGEELFKNDCVRHMDGIRTNNKPSNIEIGSYQDNTLDIPKEIRLRSAIKATQHVIVHDVNKVKEIREYYKKGHTYNETMDKFGISSKGTLWFILNKRIID